MPTNISYFHQFIDQFDERLKNPDNKIVYKEKKGFCVVKRQTAIKWDRGTLPTQMLYSFFKGTYDNFKTRRAFKKLMKAYRNDHSDFPKLNINSICKDYGKNALTWKALERIRDIANESNIVVSGGEKEKPELKLQQNLSKTEDERYNVLPVLENKVGTVIEDDKAEKEPQSNNPKIEKKGSNRPSLEIVPFIAAKTKSNKLNTLNLANLNFKNAYSSIIKIDKSLSQDKWNLLQREELESMRLMAGLFCFRVLCYKVTGGVKLSPQESLCIDSLPGHFKNLFRSRSPLEDRIDSDSEVKKLQCIKYGSTQLVNSLVKNKDNSTDLYSSRFKDISDLYGLSLGGLKETEPKKICELREETEKQINLFKRYLVEMKASGNEILAKIKVLEGEKKTPEILALISALEETYEAIQKDRSIKINQIKKLEENKKKLDSALSFKLEKIFKNIEQGKFLKKEKFEEFQAILNLINVPSGDLEKYLTDTEFTQFMLTSYGSSLGKKYLISKKNNFLNELKKSLPQASLRNSDLLHQKAIEFSEKLIKKVEDLIRIEGIFSKLKACKEIKKEDISLVKSLFIDKIKIKDKGLGMKLIFFPKIQYLISRIVGKIFINHCAQTKLSDIKNKKIKPERAYFYSTFYVPRDERSLSTSEIEYDLLILKNECEESPSVKRFFRDILAIDEEISKKIEKTAKEIDEVFIPENKMSMDFLVSNRFQKWRSHVSIENPSFEKLLGSFKKKQKDWIRVSREVKKDLDTTRFGKAVKLFRRAISGKSDDDIDSFFVDFEKKIKQLIEKDFPDFVENLTKANNGFGLEDKLMKDLLDQRKRLSENLLGLKEPIDEIRTYLDNFVVQKFVSKKWLKEFESLGLFIFQSLIFLDFSDMFLSALVTLQVHVLEGEIKNHKSTLIYSDYISCNPLEKITRAVSHSIDYAPMNKSYREELKSLVNRAKNLIDEKD